MLQSQNNKAISIGRVYKRDLRVKLVGVCGESHLYDGWRERGVTGRRVGRDVWGQVI